MNEIYTSFDSDNYIITAVIGDYYINSGKVYHKSEIFSMYEIMGSLREHELNILEMFDRYNPNEPFDMVSVSEALAFFMKKREFELCEYTINQLLHAYYTTELRDFVFNHPEESVQILGMEYFSTEQKDQLAIKGSVAIRERLATLGEKRYLDKFVHDKSVDVRIVVAIIGYKNHLDILIDDPDVTIRRFVAGHGYKEHLDKLVYDRNASVRADVAKAGIREHLDILVCDKIDDVRWAVAKTNIKEYINILVNDESTYVRIAVASVCDKELLDKLVYDKSEPVRKIVKERGFKEHINSINKTKL